MSEYKRGPSRPARETEAEPASVLPGFKPVYELLASDPARIDTVFVRKGRHGADTDHLLDRCRECGVRFTLTDTAALDRLCAGGGHQGVVARLTASAFTLLEDLLMQASNAPLPLIVALDQVQDAGNAGTLARSLYALGGAGLIIPRHNGVYLGAGARRAAAGALEHLPVAKVTNLARALDEAAGAGFTVYAAAGAASSAVTGAAGPPQADAPAWAEHARSAFDDPLELPAVLVLGSEEHGLRPMVRKRCSRSLYIPMLRDFDSLNVAQAGGMLLACFLRRHLERHPDARTRPF